MNTKLMLGSERLRLLFTNTRLIIDHAGKRGAGAVAGTSILGRLSGALEDLFKSGGESARRRGTRNMSLGQVLRSHRDNFAINYTEVVSVTVAQTLTVHAITILTRDDKFEFSTRARFGDIVELFTKTLSEKLSVRRLPQSELQRGKTLRMCMALLS
jgi:hypothetical protein